MENFIEPIEDSGIDLTEYINDMTKLIEDSDLSTLTKEQHKKTLDVMTSALLEVDEQWTDLMYCLYILERNKISIDIADLFGKEVAELYLLNKNEVANIIERYYSENNQLSLF